MIWIFVFPLFGPFDSGIADVSMCLCILLSSSLLYVIPFYIWYGFGDGDENCVLLYIMVVSAVVPFDVRCFLSPSHFNSVLFCFVCS